MSDIVIDFNKKNGRYIISSPPWMVDRMRAIPNRKWDSKGKVWTAPAIRINSQYIREKMTDAKLTADAAAAIEEALSRTVKPIGATTPAHYVPKTTPFQHQLIALNKAFPNKVFALLMEMRTGKSKVFIDYAAAHRMLGNVNMVVVICPYSIRKNWLAELATHCPIDTSVCILDTAKPKNFDKWVSESHDFKWLIVGVESLAAGSAKDYVERALLTTTRSLMGVDESHKIKNHKATRTEQCIRLGRMAERKIIMTGTPVANHPLDFYSQFEFLDPNIIGVGDYYSFRNRYAVLGGFENKQVLGYQNMPELMELISPFIYRVSRKDVFDLPPIVQTTRYVKMSARQREHYLDMAKRKTTSTNTGTITAQTVLEKMLRLHEISGGVVSIQDEAGGVLDDPSIKRKYTKNRIDPISAKTSELLEFVEEVDPSDSVIIWCAYREEISMVTEALRDRYGRDQVVEIHGGISGEERHHNVSDLFQNKKAKFLVGNQMTGGVGLNMSAASVVIYYSNTFSYVDRRQSMDRTQSIQQSKSVLYVDLVTEGTVDEIVMQALNSKSDVHEYVTRSIDDVHQRISIVH